MTNKIITKQKALNCISRLEKHKMTKAWRGYGAAIFFEFGKLDDEQKGKYTLAVEHGWSLTTNTIRDFKHSSWKDLDKKIKDFSSSQLIEANLNKKALELRFDKFVLEIDLNNLKNNKWSVNSSDIGGYLTTTDGNFVIEKEG